MNEEQWKSSTDLNDMLDFLKDKCSKKTHRKISCNLSRLVWKDLPDLGKKGIELTEKYIDGNEPWESCESIQQELQEMLPKDDRSHPISPVIWALQPSSSSYPPYYAAKIVAINITELTNYSYEDMCDVIRNTVNPFAST